MENTGNNVVVCSGSIDGGLRWHYADGTLTISGSGELPCYNSQWDFENEPSKTFPPAPWDSFAELITTIVIDNVNRLKMPYKSFDAFARCTNLKYMTFNMEQASWLSWNRGGVVHHLLQKIKYGYTDLDLWNLDLWIATTMAKVLKHFREDNITTTPPLEVVDRMIFCFEEVVKNFYSSSNDYKNDEEWQEQSKYQEKMLQEGMELLRKHFFDLSW